ncbi:MAG: pantoate--beta-alanine ligase [Candidatus Anammoxibacter sp.]
MKIITDIKEMQLVAGKIRGDGNSIGFVPTMGALHKGHLSLIKKAKDDTGCVIVSIFVNPTQFDKTDDFLSYPVAGANDHELALENGVDILFEPRADEMYPDGFDTYVDLARLSNRLCGADRPGHFKGVATVVTKLFNIVRPHMAYFGEKDLQQSVIVKQLVEDLNMDIEIVALPTVRNDDGIACSSRNRRLSADERADAISISDALKTAQSMVNAGVRDASDVISRAREIISAKKNVRKIDYISVVNNETLECVKDINGQESIAVAVHVGGVRLIDNCRLLIVDC